MYLKTSIFSFLLCAACQAQLPILPGMIPSGSSLVLPDQLTTEKLEHWWRASDLAGVTPLNYNWEDKIQTGWFWKYSQANSQIAPSVTANSVTFAGSSTLTNNARTFTFSSPSLFRTVVFVIKPASGHNATYGLFDNDALNGFFWSLTSKKLFADNMSVSPNAATNNILQDWLITQTNLSATPDLISFTNNIQSAAGSAQGATVAIFNLAGNNNTADLWGDIYEVLCYTNVPGFGGFTNVTDLANLHKYFTNTYSFFP